MAQIDGLRRYIEAGLALGQITRARAEEAVRDLIETGEFEGVRAQEWIENMLSSSRERYEAFVSTVRNEVSSQLADVGITDLDELARRVAKMLEHGQQAARKAAKRSGKKASGSAAKKSPAKKAPKKTGARKSAAKSTSKKATSKAAGTKKSSANRSATKKASASKSPSTRKSGG
jgi:polyhydroxyalkanoate synthesis regulator phasin